MSAMMHRSKVALAGALLLAACATPPTADVTRFHIGTPVPRGTIAVAPPNLADAQSLEFRAYAGAVAAELQRLGFQPTGDVNSAEILATLTVRQDVRAGPNKPPPFSIGIGGATFGRNVGISTGVAIPVGQARPTDIVDTTVALQLRRRSDQSVLWEGRAVTEARGDSGMVSNPGQVVPALARALLAGYPGESGRTVRVRL